MDKILRILHLSDLHLDNEALRDQRVVLGALFRDIKASVAAQGAYDLVFFTGDLVLKGAYTDANKAALVKEFILPLIEAAEIQPDRLILVPGNHDVDLKSQSTILSPARQQLGSDDSVSKYLDAALTANLATGLEGFNSVLDQISVNGSVVLQNNHYRAYLLNVKGINVGICALNSAWNATGAQSDGDYGKLRVSRKQLDEVVEAVSTAEFKLALVHHPVSWLTPKESQNLQRQLLLHFDGLFHGHNHEPSAQVSVGSSSACFLSNSGCLYQHRDYFNGYCSISYMPRDKRWLVKAREYFESRQEFDLAPRFAPNGEATFVRTGDGTAGALADLPSEEYVESINRTVNSRLLPSLVSDVAPKSLKSIFVEPLLSKVSQRKIDASGKNGSDGLFVPLKEVLQLERSLVFLGNRDIGKTTLLHRICQLSLEFGAAGLPPFGTYINLGIAGDTQASLLDSVVSFGGGEYRKSEIITFLNQGAVSVCFDNLDEQRHKQFKAVREFCQTFKHCRYHFTMLEDVDYSLSPAQVPKLVADAEVFYLHPFGRRETRLLTQNWFGESAEECAGKVDDILSLLVRLNVPRSPFLISALLWISEKGTQFSPVNQAEILDVLIDGVMEKLSETKDRSHIDSTIKRHYLAALAEQLHLMGKKRISALELERFTVDYFDSRGLPASTAPFLVDLKAKGILLEIGDEVTFMFEAIRAFFLSTRLHENRALLDKALSKAHFLELGEELDYYTGRHRDQDQVLRTVVGLVNEFLQDAHLGFELSAFDAIRIHDKAIDIEAAQNLRNAASQRPNLEQRNALLESVDEQVHRQSFVMPSDRNEYVQSGVGRYLEALRIASSILRNSELVRDVALKEQSYSEFADGWCRILIRVMTALGDEGDPEISPTIGEKRKDPVLRLLEGLLPGDNPGMARYLKKLIIPNVIMSLALESIGTAKLQKVMAKHYSTADTTVERLLDVFLMVDLRLSDWAHNLEAFLRRFHKNRFVCELVFSKLFQVFMLGRLRPAEEHKVKGLLAESLTLVLAEDRGPQKTLIKGAFLTNLKKKRLTQR